MKKRMLLKDVAYKSIKEKVLKGHFHNEYTITENLLVEELKMSRTPIREALQRLQSEKLLKITSNHGITVTDITVKETNNIMDLRLAIEIFALRSLENVMTVKDFDELDKIIDKQEQAISDRDIYQFLKLDIHFHYYFIDLCNNELFVETMNNIHERLFNHGNIIFRKNQHRASHSINEHKEIMQDLRIGDYGNAVKKMEQHILKGKKIYLNLD